MAATVHRFMQKYYIYDPAVNPGDELGGLRVKKDDKGTHVLASIIQIRYWIDQGLLGEKPVSELSSAAKNLLKQITRGRSEDNDTDPKRVPKYSRQMQSGAPIYAGVLAERRKYEQKQAKLLKAEHKKAEKKKTNSKPAAPPAA
jgi:hypothetical protein